MVKALRKYLTDPFLADLYREIRTAGPIKSISVDITHVCNIRCQGCYFFSENMDRFQAEGGEASFEAFVRQQKSRGTNYITVVGGEPSLVLDRVKTLYDNFRINVVTNGIRRIPHEGFQNLPIAVSVWGNSKTDRDLRGNGKRDIFAQALKNYKDDRRVFWYYTVAAGRAHEIEGVVRQCIENGNYVLFNYYSDLSDSGGDLDHRKGFAKVRHEINRMIDLYPSRILTTSYLNQVVSLGKLYGMKWGYEVCTNVSVNYEGNRDRLENGHPYNRHFSAFNADFQTSRRCCTGVDRDCKNCFDVWEHISWILLNARHHLGSKQEFTNWLTTMYLFYLLARIVNFDRGIHRLPEIHRRLKCLAS